MCVLTGDSKQCNEQFFSHHFSVQSCITRICRRTCTDSDKKKLVYIEAKTIVIVCPMNKLLLSYALSYTEEKTFDEFKRFNGKLKEKSTRWKRAVMRSEVNFFMDL